MWAGDVARHDERRIVTVLFADLVGFTSLSEPRDPESVKYLVDRCFPKLVGDLTEFGGVVDKIVGDAILALFGAPTAHEDDPERAVRVALHMQGAVHRSTPTHRDPTADRRQHRRGPGRPARVPAATGRRWVTSSTWRRGLQTRAEPGEVLVGPVTHEATTGTIEYEARGSGLGQGT